MLCQHGGMHCKGKAILSSGKDVSEQIVVSWLICAATKIGIRRHCVLCGKLDSPIHLGATQRIHWRSKGIGPRVIPGWVAVVGAVAEKTGFSITTMENPIV